MNVKIVYKDGTYRVITDVSSVQRLANEGYFMFNRTSGEPHVEPISKVAQLLQA